MHIFLLFWACLALAGCETVDSSVSLPDGRDSLNGRYEDSDIVGPSLKLSLKPEPVPPKPKEQILLPEPAGE